MEREGTQVEVPGHLGQGLAVKSEAVLKECLDLTKRNSLAIAEAIGSMSDSIPTMEFMSGAKTSRKRIVVGTHIP